MEWEYFFQKNIIKMSSREILFEPVWNNNIIKFNHHKNLPNSFRMLIIGPSNCGKTYLLLKMLLTPGFIDYDSLTVFSTTINQPEMILLKTAFDEGLTKENIIEIFQNQDKYYDKTIAEVVNIFSTKLNTKANTPWVKTSFSSESSKITLPNNLKPKNGKHLIIFDDVINNKNQDVMKQYFTRGRHNNCNCIYLSQNYFDLDKNNIRNNSNFFIFFKLSKRDKDLIYQNVFSTSLDKDTYEEICNDFWKDKYGYIAYNRDNEEIMEEVFE